MASKQTHYFATDGNYGDAESIIILDTRDFPEGAWDYLDMLGDDERYNDMKILSEGRGSFDQQDCPIESCEWTGQVVREFLDAPRGDDGGYQWTCPACGWNHGYEGAE